MPEEPTAAVRLFGCLHTLLRERGLSPEAEVRLPPADRVAFLPRGTPGPHRFTLGIYSAGRGEGRKDP